MRKALKYFLVAIVAIIVLVVLGYLLGIIGVPTVDSVENRFGDVNETTTTIETDVAVNNPNPIGVSLGSLELDYAIEMNEIPMASGSRDGVSIGASGSTIGLETYLRNENIPAWWASHIDAGEQTDLLIDVDLSHGVMGDRAVEIPQQEQIETDILAGFNSTETQEINASNAFVDDPVLYLNETAGWFGNNVSREETPVEMAFTVHNPKPWAYTITEIGYDVEMNNISVGEGATQKEYVIPGGETTEVRASTAISNQNLDDWWVSHIEQNEVTDLYIDFYVVVDPDLPGIDVEPVRLDTDAFDHETTIETDIFGTKPATDGQSDGADSGEDGTESSDGTDDSDDTADGETDGSEDSGDDGDETDGETSDGNETDGNTSDGDTSDGNDSDDDDLLPGDGGDDDEDDGLVVIEQ